MNTVRNGQFRIYGHGDFHQPGDLVLHQDFDNPHNDNGWFPKTSGVITRCWSYRCEVSWQDEEDNPRWCRHYDRRELLVVMRPGE